MQIVILLAIMITQFFPGSHCVPRARKVPVRISRSSARSVVANLTRALSPLHSAILAGSRADGSNYVCWFQKSRAWYRVDSYHYHRLFTRVVIYNGTVRVWDMHNGKLAIDSAYTHKLSRKDNVWDVISDDLFSADLDGTIDGAVKAGIYLPELNDNAHNHIVRLPFANKGKRGSRSSDEQTYYLEDEPQVYPEKTRLYFVTRIRQGWTFVGDIFIYSVEYNQSSKDVDEVSLQIYDPTNKAVGFLLTERLVYLEKNVPIPEHVFARPRVSDE
jgi:hypothetical protein